MVIAREEMVDLQMSFPPGEEGFNFPPQRKDEGDLIGGQIGAIGSNPVDFTAAFEADQPTGSQ